MERAIALTLRFANSLSSAAVRPSSVVHTGVKSAGWLKKTAHAPFFQSWNDISPSVVSAWKSGAVSPSLSDIVGSSCVVVAAGGSVAGSGAERTRKCPDNQDAFVHPRVIGHRYRHFRGLLRQSVDLSHPHRGGHRLRH